MRPSLIFEPNRILLLEPSTPRGAGEAFKEGHPFALWNLFYSPYPHLQLHSYLYK